MFEVDFLPVGDGNADAICVRYGSEEGYYLHVIDGGYESTADTIIEHIETNFGAHWHINHMVITHADNDHAAGLVAVLERFTVEHLWMNRPWCHVDEVINSFHGNYTRTGLIKTMKDRHEYLVQLERLAETQGTVIHDVFQGAQIGPFTVLAPSRERYIQLIPEMDKTPTNYGTEDISNKSLAAMILEALKKFIDESWDIETLSNNPDPVSASNETSVVQLGTIDGCGILLTGDAGPLALSEAADYAEANGLLSAYPEFVQVPHHGSRKNVTPVLLDRWLGDRMKKGKVYGTAFCSVGTSQDDYPRGQVQNAFERRGYPVHATRGIAKSLHHGCEGRPGWNPSDPEPWVDRVEA